MWPLRLIPAWALRNPFELFVASLTFMVGVPLLLSGYAPASIQAALGDDVARVWGTTLVIGGLFTTLGLRRTEKFGKYEIERAGLALLATTTVIYTIVILDVLGPPGGVAAATNLAFALACVVRYYLLGLRSAVSRAVYDELTGD